MTTKDYLLSIITQFRLTLDSHERQLECFDRYAIQVEGWLKGELVCLFDSEKLAKRLDEFGVEVKCNSGRKKVDLFLKLHSTAIWIELKHWQIGYQGEDRWKASDYFGSGPKGIGIYDDVEKLSKIPDGDKYILILATKNPEYDEPGNWEKGLDKFNHKFAPLHINSYLNPSDFPPPYFVSLLEVV